MSNDHVYRMIELAGSSENSIEDAIQNAISRASKTLHGLRWFEVVETRGHIDNGQIAHYQVVIKVGFTIDDESDQLAPHRSSLPADRRAEPPGSADRASCRTSRTRSSPRSWA
jgi:flavin-binding protein dodecin